MARPPTPTFTRAELEDLRRHAVGATLQMTWTGETGSIWNAEHDHLKTLVDAEHLLLAHKQWQQPPGFTTVPAAHPAWVMVEAEENLKNLINIWNNITDVTGPFAMTSPDAPGKRLAPRLDVFLRTYEPLNLFLEVMRGQREIRYDEIPALEHTLTQLFNRYQEALRSRPLARAIEQGKINAKRNLRSLTNYVEDLYDTYASLYVVHLDLGYHIADRRNIANATYTRLREDLRTLFYARHRNPLWKDDLVGHIWKIEDAPLRRCHAHLLLFYRGSSAEQHREDVTHLQNRWIREITHQEGACFARLDRKGDTPVWVPENTGYLIKKEDTEALGELTSYLHYLIKVDQLFGLEAGPKSYVFAKGNTPRRVAGDTP
ncbi:YagK/YfjJ domain-containing protein [Halomonas sp. FME65]|uniref:YagK/YfjJ domain-containing protein n=1 Tax=Halomonas sp. FME65 TaxID=2742614 RepID=UPI0018675E11|nr:inovirus-type Gp2 protein [Halomonas sp. FME65]